MLDLSSEVVDLTRAVCDIESVSGNEGPLADAVETALRELDGLEVTRDGHTVLARTQLDRAERVVLAGHLDTVPLADAAQPADLAGRAEPVRPRHLRHEGRGGRPAPAGGRPGCAHRSSSPAT